MIEAILVGIFIYQAVVFFLLGSWKEAISYEAGEMTFPYIITSVIAALLWPITLIWYFFSK